MWSVSPLRRHFCVVLLTLTCITSYLSIQEKYNYKNRGFLTNSSDVPVGTEFIHAADLNDNSFVVSSVWPERKSGRKNDIYILGLFELSTQFGARVEGLAETTAAQLAVNHVNHLQVLPYYNLKLLINDTKCDPGVGVDRFFHAVYSNKTILMLLGSGCSNVTESLANIVPYWNILQVSFGSTSPSLSDRNKFPLFFRTVAPDSSHNPARVAFVKYFKWNVVATLSQSENSYLLPLNNLVTRLESSNVTCLATISFSIENYKEQLRILKEKDIRIIIGSFSHKIAPKVFFEVYKLKMYGADYVWIIRNEDVNWWEGFYLSEELRRAIDGVILVSHHCTLPVNGTSVSGLTNELFETYLMASNTTISRHARQTYDAVWSVALALKKVQESDFAVKLNEFNYNRRDMVEEFVRRMSQINFVGVSGPVSYSGADRVGNTIFKQIQDGRLQTIAIYDAGSNYLDFKCFACTKIRFQDNLVPVAQRILKRRLITIPRSAFYTVLLFSTTGLVVCATFLYFNLHFRRMKTVKLSSPRLNNIAVLGCVCVYGAVVLLGIDGNTFSSKKYFSKLCTAKVCLLSAGFSLAFGSMFAKTYRVHRIFTYSGTSIVKDKLLKDKQLIVSIFLLLLIDCFIVTTWAILDPMQRHLNNLTLEISTIDRGVVYQTQVEVCRSNNTAGWFVAICGYKGFLLIMGVYMAWETRHIKVQLLNDSQYIGICVYSAFFTAIIVILSNFFSNYTTLSYLATTFTILTSTTITLFLSFLPKLKAVLGKIDVEDPLMQSMGLKIQCNTRRLVSDDPKERTYRMEVQNKVYRSELEALDREIFRLEQLLSQYPSSSLESNLSGPFIISNSNFLSTSSISKTKSVSERKINENVLGKLKKFVGSIPLMWLNSSETLAKNNIQFATKVLNEKPLSDPDVYKHTFLNDNVIESIKASSESNISYK